MRRFLIEEIRAKNGFCTITGTEAKHITKVLRMTKGDRFVLMDKKGTRFQALIEFAGKQEVQAILERPLPKPPSPPTNIILCQSVLKSKAMDYVIQKASELGAKKIMPFFSARTVVKLNSDRLISRERHWNEISLNAAKQSDRNLPADIAHPCSFEELVSSFKKEKSFRKLLLWEDENSNDLKEILVKCSQAVGVIGVVGPEGGFTREEVEIAQAAGFASVSLGHRILRAETAAITLVALVQYELGDLSLSGR